MTYSIKNVETGADIYASQTSTILLGAPSNPEALELAVAAMTKGSHVEVRTTGEYLFSAAENGALGVQASTKVLLDITVHEFNKARSRYDMSFEEKVALAGELKEHGNALFKAGQTRRAVQKYQGVLDMFSSIASLSDDEKVKAHAIVLPCHLNQAAALIKTRDFRKAIEQADKALAIEPGNAKATYRKAQSLNSLAEFEKAKALLTVAIEASPDNADFKALLANVNKSIKAQNEKDASVFKRMFA